MRKLLGKYKNEGLLFLIGSIVILSIYRALELYNQFNIYPDTESYISAADSIYFHARGHNLRPMLLAIIHGFPLLFTSTKNELIQVNIFINYICFITSGILIYKILKTYINEKTALLISSLNYLSIGIVINVFHMLSENIFIFFVLSSFYFLNRYQIEKKYLFLILSLSTFSLTMLIRPGVQIVAIIIILVFRKELILNIKNKWNSILLGSWMVICIQMAGIKYQFGNFTISYIDAVTYHNYLGTKAVRFKEGLPYQQMNNSRATYLSRLDYPEQKRVATKDFIFQLKNNTFYLFKAYLDDIYYNSIDGSVAIKDLKINKSNLQLVTFWISRLQNIFFTIIGICLSLYYLLIKNTRNKLISISGIYILYLVLTSGVSCAQGDRFHIVFYPISFLLITFYLKKKKVIS